MCEISRDFRFKTSSVPKILRFKTLDLWAISIGICLTALIFNPIHGIPSPRLPVPNPRELVLIKWTSHGVHDFNVAYFFADCQLSSKASRTEGCSFSYPAYERIRAQQHVFAGLFAFVPPNQLEVGTERERSTASGQLVSGDFFSTLGAPPMVGRTLSPDDDLPGLPPVTVLSHRYWLDHFAGDPSIIGGHIELNGVPFVIVGVASAGFQGLYPRLPTDMWLPLGARFGVDARFPRELESDPDSVWLEIVARLRPGVSTKEATSALHGVLVDNIGNTSHKFKPPQIELLSAVDGLSPVR